MKIIGIIPARYASSRFPGKPLAMIGKKTMIQRVYDQVLTAIEDVWVATDDKRIYNKVKSFNGHVVMTSPEHQSGTDRCAEAISIIQGKEKENIDVAINIQGDEPFIQKSQLENLIHCFNKADTQIATLIKKIENNVDIFNPNIVKVIIDKDQKAIYFSRSPIPHIRNLPNTEWAEHHTFYKHLGIYAFRGEVLRYITQLEPSSLENAESLEQNRWIENGYIIKTAYTDIENIGVDTPDDIDKIEKMGLIGE